MAAPGPHLGRVTARYRQALDRFLPPGACDREAQNRARLFLVSHTIGPVLGNTVPLALWLCDPTPGIEVAVLAGSISLFWLFPALLRRGVGYDRLVILSVANLNFCIMWGSWRYGGIASPTLPWFLIIPILSLFYVGGERRLQPRLLGITAAAFVLFALASLVAPTGNDIPDAAMAALGAVSTVATLLYVATMAIYYARIFDAGVDLEVEIQRRRLLTAELRRAVVAADRSGAAKSEFLARMSHEIRTPLNAIIGYGQILKEESEDAGDAALGADVDRILDAGHYLVRLIDMILDLSKIEAGRMTFDVRPHRLRDLLETAVAARGPSLAAKATRVEVVVPPGFESVLVDGKRFLQVLDGLLDNAARHAGGGAVVVSAAEEAPEEAPEEPASGRGLLVVSVRDSGPGIPPEALPTLFASFALTRDASDGRYGGSGLSLTVCSRLCEAMGGRLSAHSAPGEGSTFRIALPRRPAGREPGRPAPMPPSLPPSLPVPAPVPSPAPSPAPWAA